MKSNIFDYKDYKKLIVDLLENSEEGRRGRRKELAEFINCQVSHITAVFSGNSHLSAEQAESAARYFGLTPQETEFLLLLIQYNRAGTETLRKVFEKMISEMRDKNTNLKNRLKISDSLERANETQYYSSWHYSAVHVLISIPEFQTREAISKKLELPIQKVDLVLNFLIESGLCKKEGNKFKILRPLMHLDKSSHLISKLHTNWRLKTISELDKADPTALHYSSVFSLSKDDLKIVKEILSKALTQSLDVIKKSPEEDIGVMSLDFYTL